MSSLSGEFNSLNLIKNHPSTTMSNLIVFDMDGTLYKSELSFFKAVEIFTARYSLPKVSESFLRGLIGATTYDFKDWFASFRIDKPLEQLVIEFDTLEEQCVVDHGELYDGATGILRWIRELGWKTGVCSNGQTPYINLILQCFEIGSLIDVIRVPASESDSKEKMLRAIKEEIHPEKCFMVGDRFYDIEGARAAGYISIGAAYGYGGEEVNTADHVINHLHELKGILSRLA